MFDRATIRLGIGPHSSYFCICAVIRMDSAVFVAWWRYGDGKRGMRRWRLSDGWSWKPRVFSDIRAAERSGLRWSQALSDVRAISGSAKRKMHSRFHSPLSRFYRSTHMHYTCIAQYMHMTRCPSVRPTVRHMPRYSIANGSSWFQHRGYHWLVLHSVITELYKNDGTFLWNLVTNPELCFLSPQHTDRLKFVTLSVHLCLHRASRYPPATAETSFLLTGLLIN